MPAAIPRFPLLLVLVALAIASGCAYRPGRGPVEPDPLADMAPAWVNAPPLDPRFVYASGGAPGHDREGAIADARERMLKQLHIVVELPEGDQGPVRPDDVPDFQHAATLRLKANELPSFTVANELQNAKATYVLLALDRVSWAESLRRRVNALDARIRDVLVRPPAGSTQVSATAKRHLLLAPLVQERDDHYARLLVADPEAQIGPVAITLDQLHRDLARVLSGWTVHLTADGNLDGTLPQLEAAISELGLTITTDQASLRIDMGLRYNTTIVDGLDRAEGTFIANVSRGDDRRALGSLTTRIRGSATTPEVAVERLKNQVLRRWSAYLEQGLVECLTRM